jgi:hypothetical protein
MINCILLNFLNNLLRTTGSQEVRSELSTKFSTPVDKIEPPAAADLSLEDLNGNYFSSQIESIGRRKVIEELPPEYIFMHPLALAKPDRDGRVIFNSYAFASCLINDAYLHPGTSNEIRQAARSKLSSLLGHEKYTDLHPSLLKRNLAAIMQVCCLISDQELAA